MGSIRDYNNEFTTFILEITDMSNKDSLFYFQNGLKNWAKAELDRCGVQTLDNTIAVAKSLADYSVQPKDKGPNLEKGGGGGQKDNATMTRIKGRKSLITTRTKQSKSDKQPPKSRSLCFISNGPYWVRNCSEKKSFNALATLLKGNSVPSMELNDGEDYEDSPS